MKYYIDGNEITLMGVTDRIQCQNCGQTMALNNDGTMLIKTFVTLLEISDDQKKLTLRCGKCKYFNTVNLDNNGESLLTV